ncbi:MAG: hypothetical protein AB7I38_16395 [Dehalococcoidia bacterium]
MTAPRQLPLTISGRSPFDDVRIRWGGFGAVGLGIGLFFTVDPAGAFFGVILLCLGLATWFLSAFGSTSWHDIQLPQRYVVGTGAVVGMLIFIVFVGGFLLMAWIIHTIASNR